MTWKQDFSEAASTVVTWWTVDFCAEQAHMSCSAEWAVEQLHELNIADVRKFESHQRQPL